MTNESWVEYQQVSPEAFEPNAHFYPQVINAHIHPMLRYFMTLTSAQIARRYNHLHPKVDLLHIKQALSYVPKYFRWGGCDLFYVTTEEGRRTMVVVETNSSPSGQKSMPRLFEEHEFGGYATLLERSFLPQLQKRGVPRQGALAVFYDKNPMEASGYAATLAHLTGQHVHLVYWSAHQDNPRVQNRDGVLHVRDDHAQWIPIRGALRYVTQSPWRIIPIKTRTVLFNPIIACLAGGRNKALAAKAYNLHNAQLAEQGLSINVPETIWDLSLEEVPMWVERMGGIAVVKVPYSNAGQGVYTLTNQAELDAFMAMDHPYDRFIVQALIGNLNWSSRSSNGQRLYHMGTVPNKREAIYVADLRLMVGAHAEGFYPVAAYARRARAPLVEHLGDHDDSWSMLGTNLSVKGDNHRWSTESERLMLMDVRQFNQLSFGLDELIEAYLQTVLSMTAIDQMAGRLLNQKGELRRRLFASLNPDDTLQREILS